MRVAGGKAFTKLDLNQAYQQVSLVEKSRKYVVINTHRGLFRYNRMLFGVSSTPGVFQLVMENLLKDIPKIIVYLDDILISSETESEHLVTLEEVLQRLAGAGLYLKREKRTFLAPSVTYLGHKIDSQGLHPVTEKVHTSNTKCVSATQPIVTEVLFRFTVILFKIPPKFTEHLSTTVLFVTQVNTMEMG